MFIIYFVNEKLFLLLQVIPLTCKVCTCKIIPLFNDWQDVNLRSMSSNDWIDMRSSLFNDVLH